MNQDDTRLVREALNNLIMVTAYDERIVKSIGLLEDVIK